MVRIDGMEYDIPVISLTRKGEFQDKYAKHTEDGELHRELVGVYLNYQLKLGRSANNPREYAKLWMKLTEAEAFHTVTVPDEEGEFTFTAYFSNVGDELVKLRGAESFWRNLTVDFIAKSPVRKGSYDEL